MGSQLEDEIESWKGFPWALRKEDRELWDEMIKEVRQYYAGAVEQSGKPLTTDPFFMALILSQQRTIERLKAQLRETVVGRKEGDRQTTSSRGSIRQMKASFDQIPQGDLDIVPAAQEVPARLVDTWNQNGTASY